MLVVGLLVVCLLIVVWFWFTELVFVHVFVCMFICWVVCFAVLWVILIWLFLGGLVVWWCLFIGFGWLGFSVVLVGLFWWVGFLDCLLSFVFCWVWLLLYWFDLI